MPGSINAYRKTSIIPPQRINTLRPASRVPHTLNPNRGIESTRPARFSPKLDFDKDKENRMRNGGRIGDLGEVVKLQMQKDY